MNSGLKQSVMSGTGANNSMMNKTGSVADPDAIYESSVGKLTIPRFIGHLQSQR
jgi:hypothetical protein